MQFRRLNKYPLERDTNFRICQVKRTQITELLEGRGSVTACVLEREKEREIKRKMNEDCNVGVMDCSGI